MVTVSNKCEIERKERRSGAEAAFEEVMAENDL